MSESAHESDSHLRDCLLEDFFLENSSFERVKTVLTSGVHIRALVLVYVFSRSVTE